uniref:Uncharacterized protein LOC104249256 n=1 Tax=Nicotiana sylvestris TaxID=4096 RepID=A0A1U7YXQ8_NICSY|nr:PREDICTED: uncharacterized protein LOC104249256 [Nicotiana sylvestris]
MSFKLQRGELFSIKKLYRLQFPQHQKVQWKSIILQQHIHPRFKFILWLALHNRLATVERLLKFGIQTPQQCIFCEQVVETFDHLSFKCSLTKELWLRLLRWLGYDRPICDWQSEVEWVSKNAKRRNGQCAIVTCVFGMLVNAIWRERNKLRFQGGKFSGFEEAFQVASRSSLFPLPQFAIFLGMFQTLKVPNEVGASMC